MISVESPQSSLSFPHCTSPQQPPDSLDSSSLLPSHPIHPSPSSDAFDRKRGHTYTSAKHTQTQRIQHTHLTTHKTAALVLHPSCFGVAKTERQTNKNCNMYNDCKLNTPRAPLAIDRAFEIQFCNAASKIKKIMFVENVLTS